MREMFFVYKHTAANTNHEPYPCLVVTPLTEFQMKFTIQPLTLMLDMLYYFMNLIAIKDEEEI